MVIQKKYLNIFMIECNICSSKKIKLIKNSIKDFEYSISTFTSFYKCCNCNLFFQYPYYKNNDINKLYPKKNYSTRSSILNKKGFFPFLKKILILNKVYKVKKLLKKNSNVLDVGCGSGDFLNLLKKHRPDLNLFGLDISSPKNTNSFIFYKGFIENINFSNKFDFINMTNLIEHVHNPSKFIKKINLILNAGGFVAGDTPSTHSLDRYMFGKYWGGYHYPRHTFLFNKHNLSRLFYNFNFKKISIKGSYSYWYISLKNFLTPNHGFKKRGLLFFLITLLFSPIDIIANLFIVHGNINFLFEKKNNFLK